MAFLLALVLGAGAVHQNFESVSEVSSAERLALEAVLEFEEKVVDLLADGGNYDRSAALRLIESRYLDFIRRYPRNVPVRNYLGGFYQDAGRPADAYRAWRGGLRLDRANAYLYNNLAEYYGHDAGRPDLAVAYTRRAIRLKPEVAVFHFNLATYYDVFRYVVVEEYGSAEAVFDACLAHYRRAAELAPASYEFARDYALTVSFSPMVWRIADPSGPAEKISAWQRCLDLAPDESSRVYVESMIQRVSR